MDKKQYKKMAEKASPPSPIFKNMLLAFFIGGVICALGQVLGNVYKSLGLHETDANTLVSVSLIFLSVLLTALNVYDKIAKHAGGGTLVPITGFANSVAAPAIEFKTEGFVLGVGANMFKIAGPVIVYGTVASVVYGVVYWITTIM